MNRDACTLTDCDFSQDRKGGGVGGVGGRKEGRNWNGRVGKVDRNPHGNRERMNGRSRKENVQIRFAERACFFTQQQ